MFEKTISRVSLAGFFSASLLFAPAIANAETVSLTVPAGKKSLVRQIGIFDKSRCARSPKPKIFRKTAQNGTLTTGETSFKMDKGNCKGMTLRGTAVYYQPNKGFRGKDKIVIRYSFPAGQDVAFSKAGGVTINVTVK